VLHYLTDINFLQIGWLDYFQLSVLSIVFFFK